MDLLTILLITIVLAMDAFSISITKGFYLKNITKIQTLWVGVFFGGFHASMPILGYIAGVELGQFLSSIAPWIGFIILLAIGFKMIFETKYKNEENSFMKEEFSFKELTLLSIATSIDALAIGVIFAILKTPILPPLIFFGIIVFIFSEIGIIIGKKISRLVGDKFETISGLILIILGIKILLDGLGIF